MLYIRGLFFGIFLVIGSIEGLLIESAEYLINFNGSFSKVFWIVMCFIGSIQTFMSINYVKAYKLKILFLCFLLEGIYYTLIFLLLLTIKMSVWYKIFGFVILFVLLFLIFTAIFSLHEKLRIQGRISLCKKNY